MSIDYLALSLLYDWQFSLFLAPLCLLVFWVSSVWFRSNTQHKILAHFVAIAAGINFLLVFYYSSTLVPLGSDFWGYSLSELTDTVIAAEQISIWSILLITGLYYVVYIWSIRILNTDFLSEFNSHNSSAVRFSTAGIIILTVIGGLGFYFTETEKRSNKLKYFAGQSLEFYVSLLPVKSTENYSFNGNNMREYPLLAEAERDDVLGSYFEKFTDKPNIVFIIVESLGGEFIGPSKRWSGFAPFLDSLAGESLYWENGLSLSGRTFGMVPAIFGSLPFGTSGFMDLGPDYPDHHTLISLLDERGYYTAFYSGYNTYFDKLNLFLEHQGIDFILNNDKLKKLLNGRETGSNYWGYDDKTMLDEAIALLDTASVFPRLEIYHTLQSHSPFTVPEPQQQALKFNRLLESLNRTEQDKITLNKYQPELTSLMFTDEALQAFMNSYRKYPHYKNTIFVITGDHWLIPVPQTSAISRYHVPIIIYSPKLKRPRHFKSVNPHASLAPTLSTFLNQNTEIDMPDQVSWLQGAMDTADHFRIIHSVPLMRNKNQITDYLHHENYLSGEKLYRISGGLNLQEIENETLKGDLEKKLEEFKNMNRYVVKENKIYPPQNRIKNSRYDFLVEYDSLFRKIDSLGLTIDQQFEKARSEAFDGNYDKARAMAKRILLEYPDYHDVRILIGRTYAWDGDYVQARKNFREVLEREPTYRDTYNAYFDNEFWAGNYRDALEVINRGLEFYPEQESLLERKIKILSTMDRGKEAGLLFERLKKINPDYKNLSKLRSYIK